MKTGTGSICNEEGFPPMNVLEHRVAVIVIIVCLAILVESP